MDNKEKLSTTNILLFLAKILNSFWFTKQLFPVSCYRQLQWCCQDHVSDDGILMSQSWCHFIICWWPNLVVRLLLIFVPGANVQRFWWRKRPKPSPIWSTTYVVFNVLHRHGQTRTTYNDCFWAVRLKVRIPDAWSIFLSTKITQITFFYNILKAMNLYIDVAIY